MTARELIARLQPLPQDAKVYHLWDGELRTEINVVYEAQNGSVVTADYGEVCYSSGARPIGTPSSKEEQFWKTEKRPDRHHK